MTYEQAIDKMIETIQIMQRTQIRQTERLHELNQRVVLLEDMNSKIVFMLEAVLDQNEHTFH